MPERIDEAGNLRVDEGGTTRVDEAGVTPTPEPPDPAATDRLFNASAIVTRNTWGRDAAGGRSVASIDQDAYAASAQPLSAMRTPEHLRATGKTVYRVHFRVDPVVRADDLIELPDGTILNVLAPARDQAGRGVVWSVEAVRVS